MIPGAGGEVEAGAANAPAQARRAHVPAVVTPHLPPAGGFMLSLLGTRLSCA
jgi:hypothetical protein